MEGCSNLQFLIEQSGLFLPLTLILDASCPRMTARLSSAKMSLDIKVKTFDQTAGIANEVCGGVAPGLLSYPWQRANVTCHFKLHIDTE
jgi:hypothetical protein